MRYISLLLLVGFMGWTWSVINEKPVVADSVHANIQEDLKDIIANYIKSSLPNSQNLSFEKMWTESVDNNKVKASFTYSFDDQETSGGPARVQIEGVAILNRIVTSNPDEPAWSFDELYMLNNHIVFKEGFELSPQITN